MAQPHMQALVTNTCTQKDREMVRSPEMMFFQFGSWQIPSQGDRLVGTKHQNPQPGQGDSLYHVLGKPAWATTRPSYAGGPWGHPDTPGD